MSKISFKSAKGPTRKSAGTRVFSCLGDLLAYQARTATDRIAILGPGPWSITYGALWASSNYTVHRLRSVGVSRTDRVAVVLPNGPETAMTIIAVAVGAVCVPLNPGFTADECRRYFAELGLVALLTRPDVNSASRDVAQTLGIPVIELWTGRREAAGMSRIKGLEAQWIVKGELASGADDAFILSDLGDYVAPKDGSADTRERLPVGLQRWCHVSAWTRGSIAERAASVSCAWADFRHFGCLSRWLECGLHAGFRCRGVPRLA